LNSTYSQKNQTTRANNQWKRDDVSKLMHVFENAKHSCSQRQFSRENGVARTTLRHWLARKNAIDESPALVAFLESPEGMAFIHRLITAAHLEFTKNGAASIHNVSNFLKMIGLSPFVATSYWSQRRVACQMDEQIIAFEEYERRRLSAKMPSKTITICEDETFHPQVRLVAIEPVSNFILIERYAEDRKTETWDKAVFNAVKDLPVDIVQVASDQSGSLIRHARKSLKVHHSPDCFHVIYEIGKGTCVAMASKVRKAEVEYAKKQNRLKKLLTIKKPMTVLKNALSVVNLTLKNGFIWPMNM
jgi:lambda repressor-like predicted transcriptional regulator